MENNKILLRKTLQITIIKIQNIVNQMKFLTFLAFYTAQTQFLK
jgi:hypothetical protein